MKVSTSTAKPTGRAPKRSWPAARRSSRRWTWPAYRQLLHRSRWPILVGPWYSELGFETLYWLPWLTQVREDLQIDPARLVPITCGGMAALYGCPQALELYAMRDPQALRIESKRRQQQTGSSKQYAVTAFDREIYRDAARTLGLGRSYLTLHPAWMYHQLRPFWESARGLGWLQHQVQHRPLPVLDLPPGVTLPDPFIAARFYARSTWPAHTQTAAFATAMLRTVATDMPIVVLNANLHADDHLDYEPKPAPNLLWLRDLVPITFETNLALQMAVIARAQGFIGTYGGLAQTASLYGKPTISVYLNWEGVALPHKQLSEALALHRGLPWYVVRMSEIPLLQAALPQVVVTHPQATPEVLTPRPEEAHTVTA